MLKTLLFAILSTSVLTLGAVWAFRLRKRPASAMSTNWLQDELPAHEHEQSKRDGFLWMPEN